MARLIAEATGLPVGGPRGSGVMGERRTLVGSQGRRLRVFAATATPRMRGGSCRFITEAGCLTNADDRRVMERPDFPRRQAVGVLRAYTALAIATLGWDHPSVIGMDNLGDG